MLKILFLELYKLFRMKVTYLFLLGTNLVSLIFLLGALVLSVRAEFSSMVTIIGENISVEKLMMIFNGSQMIHLLLVTGSVFFFISLLIGQVVCKEFSSGSMRSLLISPYSRSKIFAGKYLAIIVLFLITTIIGFLSFFIGAYVFFNKCPAMKSQLNIPFLTRNIGNYFLINFSMIAFLFLIAVWNKKNSMMIGRSVTFYIGLKLLDIICASNDKFNFLGFTTNLWNDWSYTVAISNLDYQSVSELVQWSSLGVDIQVRSTYIILGYTLIFILISFWGFSRREA